MLKKTSAAVKTCIVFSIDFSLIFRQKSMQSHARSVKNGLVHRNRRKSTFGKSFFGKKTILDRFLGFLWVSGGLLPPKSFIFFINFQLRVKRRPGPASRRPQGGLGSLPGISRAPFCVDFGSVFRIDLHTHTRLESR